MLGIKVGISAGSVGSARGKNPDPVQVTLGWRIVLKSTVMQSPLQRWEQVWKWRGKESQKTTGDKGVVGIALTKSLERGLN